jgi:peptidase M28-like protein
MVERSVLEHAVRYLATINRPSASPGEREAAEWIAERLREEGCETRVEEERAHGTYWWPLGLLSTLAAVSGLVALRGRRVTGGLLGALASLGLVDESSGGRYWFRGRLPQRPTWNVVAETGDRGAARTLVLLAHHDAAHSGLVFHPEPQRRLAERFPALVERLDTSPPIHWPFVSSGGVVAAGSALGARSVVRIGISLAVLGILVALDIGRRPAVAGANDNLSAVAAIVVIACLLRERPVSGLRVLLVSCGSEESLQEGIRAFARRHFGDLPTNRSYFLNLETVGSPHQLALLEGEGPVRMADYPKWFRELVADCAEEASVPLRRGLRSRFSTDSVVPNRAGYPVATIVSLTRWKALANYHWPTDIPENVDYERIGEAVRVAEAVIRRLADQGG